MHSLKEIANLFGSEGPQCQISSFAIDSRSVVRPSDTLFVAITTAGNDGHRYIAELYRIGVRAFMVSDGYAVDYDSMPDATFIKVPDTIAALHALASAWRRALPADTTVVAVTGSRGKTVVKEMVNEAMPGNVKCGRSPRSWNSHIGVPLSLLSLDGDENVVIVEAGVSKPGEMQLLNSTITPDIAAITCVTDEHMSNFGSRHALIDEKLNVCRGCRVIVFNSDDHEIAAAIASRYPDATLIGVHAGFPEVDNRKIAAGIMQALNLPADGEFHAQADTRLEIAEGVNNCKIILDKFTPDMVSLRGALDFMHRRAPKGLPRTIVLDPADYRHGLDGLPRLVADYDISRMIVIGTQLPDSSALDCRVEYHATAADLSANDFSSETLLIKSSPTRLTDALYSMVEAKQHETVLEVNLDAVVHNFNFFRDRLKPTTGVICMLKAAGYGAGSVELARTLQAHGAAYIAVAVVDEGIELRQAGITMPIMVLNPRVQNLKLMFDYQLEPEIYNLDLLDDIIAAADRYGVEQFPVHIKAETGMSRLGFLPDEMPEVSRRLSLTSRIKAATMFSHLACADDPSDDDYTLGQFDTFDHAYSRLVSQIDYKPKRHILNSTGIIRFPQRQMDFVRLGIGLYGIPTLDDGSESALQCVSTLSSVVISVKHWEKGRSIGYNRRTRLDRDSIIATIPIGYADGLDRRLGNRHGSVMIHDRKADIVGNVCMDIIMADVTDIVASGYQVVAGDRVEIFGSGITPMDIASTLDTIPYEILTSISPRVKRVYYRE